MFLFILFLFYLFIFILLIFYFYFYLFYFYFYFLNRQWMTPLGLSMILSSLSARIFQIAMIYRYYKKLIQVTRRHLNIWLFAPLSISFLSQVIILAVWSGVDPYSKNLFILDQVDLTTDINCKSNNLKVWVSLLFAHFGIQIIFSMIVIYVTWSINNRIGRNGSR